MVIKYEKRKALQNGFKSNERYRTKKRGCGNCLSRKNQEKLDKTDINYNCYNGSTCSNPFFYLEDLGIIKILKGIFNRNSGVDCGNLEIKVLHNPFECNKI